MTEEAFLALEVEAVDQHQRAEREALVLRVQHGGKA